MTCGRRSPLRSPGHSDDAAQGRPQGRAEARAGRDVSHGAIAIIGDGTYRYRPASGRKGERFLVGLSRGTKDYRLHICVGDKDGCLVERNAAKLGKVKAGRSCINCKQLEDLKLDAVLKPVKQAGKSGGINAVA